ncbi:MAG: hypothetical protein CBB68_00435 [Rhodospirillaceae bacterium TMED8]|nr:hypothetical protein [Magnetovibrio sp.]OUT53352.1 MAG: hypothetical protein CBB68_00435 [Rhodospirillaceae bacterium TMED8]|tara:strand:- start:2790 stop:3185 length:396 start_codon:yes stop_codon:yes gene_type:complete
MFFGLFGNRREREALQLNKDAPVIIDHAEQMFTDNRLQEIAEMVDTHLSRVRESFGRTRIDIKRAHYEYRKLHKEARRNNHQASLTALTLVIIHLRAEINGTLAVPACASIDAAMVRWLAGNAVPLTGKAY